MNPATTNETIVVEITIKGSADRIFEAIANPQERLKWWGAKGTYESTEMESDLRTRGKWIMKGVARGNAFTCYGKYTRIERPRLLEFTWNPSWVDETTESLVRFDLNETDGITTVRVTHSALTSAAREVHKGWPQVLGWLKAHLE